MPNYPQRRAEARSPERKTRMSRSPHFVIAGAFVDAEDAARLDPAARTRLERAKARLVAHLASVEVRAMLAEGLDSDEAVCVHIGGDPYLATAAGVLPLVGGGGPSIARVG